MAMMRRGPLDRYPPEWVLREASAHQIGGSIQFHADAAATFYLDAGQIYAALPGVEIDEDLLEHPAGAEEATERARVVELLTAVLRSGASGWYYHDPLGHHPGKGAWEWETATLLKETAAQEQPEAAAPPAEPAATPLIAPAPPDWSVRTVALHGPAPPITLEPDAWAVVVALAQQATAADVRSRLGWEPDRLLLALTQIELAGGLVDDTLPPPPIATLPPPPTATDGADDSRWRKLPGRRSTGS